MKEKRKPLWHWFPVIVGVESWTSLLRSECGENGLLGCHDGELKNYKLIFVIFFYISFCILMLGMLLFAYQFTVSWIINGNHMPIL